MGCWISSPHQQRVYRDPGDLDEEVVPLRYFGTFRTGSNLIPDDIAGLPATHTQKGLATNQNLLLYEAEIDHGLPFRCCRPMFWILFLPGFAVAAIAFLVSQGLSNVCVYCSCDQICCWVRKEYSTRTFFRIYPNRIVINNPRARWPFGYFGCGSWNGDAIMSHPFDRGAFGFQRVKCGVLKYICCLFPVYGGAVARQRCNCNGPLWNRMFSDCGGWWCDEWLCSVCFCSYLYGGLAYPDEVAFACSIALQAYFEGRSISREDMDKCLAYWKENVSEVDDPVAHKRDVCCERIACPFLDCSGCYECLHPRRDVPYADDVATDKVREAYDNYNSERTRQIAHYKKKAKAQHSSLCKTCGCRRVCGRRGLFFCTEGCDNCDRKAGEPAPPPAIHDFDDDHDATTVLMKVLGPPPANVVIKRWRYDPETGEHVLHTYPETEEVVFESHAEQPTEKVVDIEAPEAPPELEEDAEEKADESKKAE